MKLFGFPRSHRPDVDALSALVDGALDSAATAEIEAHIAGCAACAAELDGLQRVKSMLAALPQVAPTRSFRVRQADVEAPARHTGAPVGGLLRAMPALAAAAAVVFVGALATDFSTRDGDGGRQASSAPVAADSAARSAAEIEGTLANDGDDFAESPATQYFNALTPAASGAIPPDGTLGDTAGGEDRSEGTDGAESGDAPTGGAGTGGEAAEDPAPAPPTGMEPLEAAYSEPSDDDDGNRTAFVIVEVAAAAVALGALALFVVNRRSRSEGQA